ncbi:Gfo/Idh/MocA family oxidoreductase [Terribacillus sp. DMT04]|uniref:Gfo/Idh/MocA family oxidoreductase n=1 Tax=Terribacillus sp. DMT04 TaxID=2850441 RepID=UPI001C2BC711|nr:Gfo/Idh/MocA family oxidoreductase [Terribacillus sp. DMT04]QXE03252.1 Gfo/Idh/MocA family oxidoreductase [Terribacillus sp. DMT04]
MLKIGFIGNGKSTNRYHLPFLMHREHIEVTMIYARNLDKKDRPDYPSFTYTDDLTAVMTNPAINLISVCTPIESHYMYAKMALENGKHVMVEKPFALNTEETKELFALAKEKDLVIQCYQNRRHDADFLTIQKVIESGKLGELIEVEMNYDYYRAELPAQQPFSEHNSFLYGHGVHTVDQAISYFGDPERTHFDVRQLSGADKMNDYFDLDLYYPTYKVSIRSSFYRLKPRPSFAVYGKKGVFIKETQDRQEEHLKLNYLPEGHDDFGVDLPAHYGTLTYLDKNGIYHEEKVISVNGDYGRVYDDVYRVIFESAEKKIKDEETIRVMDILERAMKERN